MPAVIALSAALTLTACSGDDDGGGDDPQSNETPSAASESPTVYPVDGCEADVKVTGAAKIAWKGDGQVSESGEAATLYQSQDGKKSWIAVTAGSDDAPSQVVVTVKGTTYPVLEKGLQVKESDDGVTAKATVQVDKGEDAKVTATFTCAEKAG